MNTRELILRLDHPMTGIRLAELTTLRERLDEQRVEQEAHLNMVEARQDALFAEGVGRSDLRGQRARADQIATRDQEANQVAALLRVIHKQLLLLDHLIWLRESLDAIERLRQDIPATVPVDWPALINATEPLGDDEARLDQLNDALEKADTSQTGAPDRPTSPDRHSGRPEAGAPSGLLVVRVLDGATIELANGHRVRYIGVDSPQMKNALGKPDAGAWDARDANRALVGHKRVRLEADQLDADIDGALWRYVYLGDTFINAELLRQGAAYYAGRYPNNRHAEPLLAAEQDARRRKRGVWKA